MLTVGMDETFDIGRDTGATVADDLRGDGAFNGHIKKVEVHLGPLMAPVRMSAQSR